MTTDPREAIALFRYAVISAATNPRLSPAERGLHAVRAPQDASNGRDEPSALVDERPTEVHVIKQHVRSRIEAEVGDRVDESNGVAAKISFDTSPQA